MRTLGIFFFLMISVLNLGYAQKKQAWVDAANHAFTVEKDYYKAYKYYEAALAYRKDTSDVLHLLYQKAESARLMNAYVDAQDAYLELVGKAPSDFMAKSPYRCTFVYLGYLQLSRAYSGSGPLNPVPYEKALAYFTAYESLAPALQGDCDDRVAQGKAIVQFVMQGKGATLSNESIKIEDAGPNINSEFPDFAPMSWGDRLYFTSFRQAITGKGMQAPRYFSRIYLSSRGEPAEVMPTINLTPKDTLHVGHTTINQAHNRMYFTRCEYVDGTLQTRCDLYYNQLNSQGDPTGTPVEVVELNLKNSTLTHPTMGWDPVREREVLFFASDRPGTRGNMDIWKSELVDGHFTPPTNNLVINTKGNEITPFYQNGILYFSSDNQPDSYGGYDIFFTPDPTTKKPSNLGQKINSSADESYYSRNEEGNLAYFSSNRLTANTLGVRDNLKESASLDIYYYLILKPSCTLEVSAFSECANPGNDRRQALDKVNITLFDITDTEDIDREKGIEASLYGENSYRFDNILEPDRKYLIVGNREGFKEQRQILDFSDGKIPCINGTEKLELYFRCEQPLLQVQVYHHDQQVREAIVHMIPLSGNNQDLSKRRMQRIAEGSQIPCSGENIFNASYAEEKRMKSFSEEFPLDVEQTYLVIAELSLPDSLLLGFTTYQASENSEAFCAGSCKDILRIDLEARPSVQLFFEKGVPGPHPYDISNLSFLMTLDRYQNRKATYLQQYPASGKAELEQFFNEKIDQSFPPFYEFLQQATDLLCQNIPITIEAKSCTTPKFITQTPAQEEYTKHLANRRAESIEQELIGFGLSTERWSNLYRFEVSTQACEVSNRPSNILENAWRELEHSTLQPFSLDAARSRRVELKLKIGLETDN